MNPERIATLAALAASAVLLAICIVHLVRIGRLHRRALAFLAEAEALRDRARAATGPVLRIRVEPAWREEPDDTERSH